MSYSSVTTHTFKCEQDTYMSINLSEYGSSSIYASDHDQGQIIQINVQRDKLQKLINQTINNLKLSKTEADRVFVRELLKECQDACSQWSKDELAAARETEQKRQDELNEGWET